jgi:hypothetical protein
MTQLNGQVHILAYANLYMFNVLILVSKLDVNIEKYYCGAELLLGVLEA